MPNSSDDLIAEGIVTTVNPDESANISPMGPRVNRDFTRLVLIHGMAERERALADGAGTPEAGWRDTAAALTDVLAGLWLAPVTK